MNILEALHKEENKLESKLSAIQAAIGALDGSSGNARSGDGRRRGGWKMSASAKARIAKAQRARWRKIKAEKKGRA